MQHLKYICQNPLKFGVRSFSKLKSSFNLRTMTFHKMGLLFQIAVADGAFIC